MIEMNRPATRLGQLIMHWATSHWRAP